MLGRVLLVIDRIRALSTSARAFILVFLISFVSSAAFAQTCFLSGVPTSPAQNPNVDYCQSITLCQVVFDGLSAGAIAGVDILGYGRSYLVRSSLLNKICLVDIGALTCTDGNVVSPYNGACVPRSAAVDCVPSVRTVAPCPSGFSPSNVAAAGAMQPDTYSSAMDAMPMQDLLYVLGVAICGLLGIGTGARLI